MQYRATLGMEEIHDKAMRTAPDDKSTPDPPSCWHRPKRLQFFAAILLMILNIVNVFMIAFVGQIKEEGPDGNMMAIAPPTPAAVG